jgi:hypothetical protein
MKAGDLIVVRLRIGARLDQQDAEPPEGEIRRQRSAAGTGSDDDVLVELVLVFDMTPPA